LGRGLTDADKHEENGSHEKTDGAAKNECGSGAGVGLPLGGAGRAHDEEEEPSRDVGRDRCHVGGFDMGEGQEADDSPNRGERFHEQRVKECLEPAHSCADQEQSEREALRKLVKGDAKHQPEITSANQSAGRNQSDSVQRAMDAERDHHQQDAPSNAQFRPVSQLCDGARRADMEHGSAHRPKQQVSASGRREQAYRADLLIGFWEHVQQDDGQHGASRDPHHEVQPLWGDGRSRRSNRSADVGDKRGSQKPIYKFQSLL